MNTEIWQQLFSLETRDIITRWFAQIHSRELNARRAREINAAAKQAREYFRNASNSNYSVRPLLTFYGIACLSRSLLLLLKAQGGEEGLTARHGLETVDWVKIMSGDTAKGLKDLCNLRIRTTSGLFSDFITHTKNRISIHVNSSNVDWHICYDIPKLGDELSLGDLFSRIPDLQKEYTDVSGVAQYVSVNELTYNEKDGFKAKVREEPLSKLKDVYESYGYSVTSSSGWITLSADAKIIHDHFPLFIHSYINKQFGSIPRLHISVPFPSGVCYSQLSITYMVSFILGMLVRYYPTHWISLIQGEKGDIWWPTINRAQQLVENSYPELVIELITDILKQCDSN
ncbi:MAG: YaaC family protein [Syntrophobacteraceae bacterium]|jgi:hypothetical protein